MSNKKSKINIEFISIHLEEEVTIDGSVYKRTETNDQILWEEDGNMIEEYEDLEGQYQQVKHKL